VLFELVQDVSEFYIPSSTYIDLHYFIKLHLSARIHHLCTQLQVTILFILEIKGRIFGNFIPDVKFDNIKKTGGRLPRACNEIPTKSSGFLYSIFVFLSGFLDFLN
jgi:hypothetical protein